MRLIHFFFGSATAAAFLREGLTAPELGYLLKVGMLPSVWKFSPLPSMAVVGRKEFVSWLSTPFVS